MVGVCVPGAQGAYRPASAPGTREGPDKIIFNETMCAKIEELAAAAAPVYDAFEAVLPYIEQRYYAALLRRTADARYQAALVNSTAELARRERDARDIIRFEERNASRDLAAEGARQYDDALARKNKREAEELATEMGRRARETSALDTLCEAAWADIDTFVASRFDGLEGIERRRTLARLLGLIDALLADPSNVGARRIRNDHPMVLEHFGHPYASSAAVRQRYGAVEAVLAAAGYRPGYALAVQGAVATGSDGWTVERGEVPWRGFGERSLDTTEPVADANPDAWIAWHDRLQRVRAAIARLCR